MHTDASATADNAGDGAALAASEGPTARVVRSAAVLTPAPDNAKRRAGVSSQLVVPRGWRRAKMPGGEVPVYREGMGSVVLEGVRARVAENLLELARACEDGGGKFLLPMWEGDEWHHRRGCVLFTAPEGPAGEESAVGEVWAGGAEEAARRAPPGRYATVDLGFLGLQFAAKLPLHNLRILLGEARLGELRAASALFRENRMLMLSRPRSRAAQVDLWRLQGLLEGVE